MIESLMRSRRPALLRYFNRKGFWPPDDEDAVQEVFVRLVRRSGLSEEVDRPEAYLFSTAANVAADLYRAARSRGAGRHDLYEDTEHFRTDLSPEEILRDRESLAIVLLALNELPERTRAVFVLARLELMKQAEIGRRLGISIHTVEKHLHRAVAFLGRRIGRGE